LLLLPCEGIFLFQLWLLDLRLVLIMTGWLKQLLFILLVDWLILSRVFCLAALLSTLLAWLQLLMNLLWGLLCHGMNMWCRAGFLSINLL
jgi:hypothetical protein